MTNFYGTMVEANSYFSSRLHTGDWDISTADDRMAAMVEAAELIDQFDYIGEKFSVQESLDALGSVDLSTDENQATLRAAELSQALEFPRGDSNVVPEEIERAGYLIAKALLSGRSPDDDLEGLSVKSTQYGGVKTTYHRSGIDQEHTAHLIPSAQAWTLIRPFIRERSAFDTKRVS